MSDDVKTPPKAKQKRQRRNYAAELQDLQNRVGMARRIIRQCEGLGEDLVHALLVIAEETLEGK